MKKMCVIFNLYKMEELIASKYEDILNKRGALCMEILTSEKDLEDMLKETISMRRKLEKIKEDYTLKKRKIFDITNPIIQKLMNENNVKKTEVKIKLLFSKSKDESTELRSQLNSLSKVERKLIRKL